MNNLEIVKSIIQHLEQMLEEQDYVLGSVTDRDEMLVKLQTTERNIMDQMDELDGMRCSILDMIDEVHRANPDPEPELPDWVNSLQPGLYKLFWADGGQSLAAIGQDSKGYKWFVPTDWVANIPCRDWYLIDNFVSIAKVSSWDETANEVLEENQQLWERLSEAESNTVKSHKPKSDPLVPF